MVRMKPLVAFCALSLVPVIGAGSSATASPPCSAVYDGSSKQLSITCPDSSDELILELDGGAIFLTDQDGPVIPSGGSPTTTTTDSIIVTMGGGDDLLTLEEGGGLWAPGSSGESDSPEIEFQVTGGSGADTIEIDGQNIDDTIDLGVGGFNFNGDGDADMTWTDTIEAFLVDGAGGNDTMNAAGSPAVGTAIAQPVEFFGQSGDDVMTGGSANDRFTGATGNDTMDGQAGTDTLDETGNVNFSLTASQLTGLGTDTLASLEAAELTGGKSANTINATTFSGPVLLTGMVGNDVLTGGASGDRLVGGGGGDKLFGLAANDKLFGQKGNDTHNGGPGRDVCKGGSGVNTFKKCEVLG